MKKHIFIGALIFCMLFLCGCANSSQTLAKSLDDTITNLVYAVSSLDWADNELISDLASNDLTNNGIAEENLNSTITPLTNQYITETPSLNQYQDATEQSPLSSSYNTSMSQSMSGSKVIRQPFSRNKVSKINGVQNSQIDTINNLNSRLNSTNLLENSEIVNVKYSLAAIEEQTNEVMQRLASLVQRRTNILLYVNALYNSKLALSKDMTNAINAYINIIKDNTAYLNSNKGIVTNQLSQASSIKLANAYSPLINAYIIRTSEAIDTRIAKLDASIMAIDSIIQILEANTSGTIIPDINDFNSNNISLLPNITDTQEEIVKNNEKIITENKNAENTQINTTNIIKNEQNVKIETNSNEENQEETTSLPNVEIKTESESETNAQENDTIEEVEVSETFNFIDKNYRERCKWPPAPKSSNTTSNEIYKSHEIMRQNITKNEV